MGRRLEVCEFAAPLYTAGEVARYGDNKSFYVPHKYNSALMYLVPRYVYVGICTRAASPKTENRRPIDEIAPKKPKVYYGHYHEHLVSMPTTRSSAVLR